MKKLVIIMMIGVTMLVSLTACGLGQTEAPEPVLDEGIENIEYEDIEIEDIEIEDVEPTRHQVTWFTSGQHFGEPMPYCKVGVRP